jgi:signal transduction histidine kinase
VYQIFRNYLKAIVVLVVVLLSTFSLRAQKIDSLKSLLATSSGLAKYEVLFALAYEYSDVNDSISLIYADDLFAVATEMGDSSLITTAGRIKAGELRRLERLDEAIQMAQDVLQIARQHNDITEIKLLLNSLALSHTLMAQYDSALKYNFESLVIREAEGSKQDISIALNNIGLIYYKLRDYNKSIEYYDRSLVLKREANDQHDLDRLLINIGLCYNFLKNYEEAKRYFKDALAVCKDECSDLVKLESQFGLGVSYYGTTDYAEGLTHFQISFAVAKKIESSRYQAENLIYMARIHMSNRHFEKATEMLLESERLSSEKGYNFLLIETYRYFSKLFSLRNDFENVSRYQSRYIKLKDSIYSEDLIKNLAKVQSDYEERENIKTIAEKDEVLRLKEEVIDRQRQQNVFIVLITLLFVGLAAALFWAGILQRKANRLLADSRSNLAKKVDERTAELVHAKKELDHFIYKTSHDIRGPLATFKGLCMIARTDIKDPVGLDLVRMLDVTADRMILILNRLLIINTINTTDLKPELVDLKSCIDEIMVKEENKGLPPGLVFKSDIDSNVVLMSDKKLVDIVLDNLIDNSIKFFDQSDRVVPMVEVKIRQENNLVLITVTDNGIGIDAINSLNIFQMFFRASERSQTGGIGLYLSRLATEKLGGTIELVPTPGKFTRFLVRIPSTLEDKTNSKGSKNDTQYS